AARADDSAARLHALERGVADLEALWAEMEDRAKSTASELTHRLDALDEAMAARLIPEQVPAAQGMPAPSLQIVSPSQPIGDIKLITTGSDAVAHLAKNLLSIGLKASAAPVFAQEVLAA